MPAATWDRLCRPHWTPRTLRSSRGWWGGRAQLQHSTPLWRGRWGGGSNTPVIITEKGSPRSGRGFSHRPDPPGSVHIQATGAGWKRQVETAHSDSDLALKDRDKGKLGSWSSGVGGPQREEPLTGRGRTLACCVPFSQKPAPRRGL